MKFPCHPLVAVSLAGSPFASADTLPLALQGNTSSDVWAANSLGATANPGFPGALNFALPWPSSIPTSNGGDAFLTKLANGPTGGPIPSGQSIYFVSFANVANTYGGTLAVNDGTPLAGLSTLAFQIEIGGANGYDLFNNNLAQAPDLSSVKLRYTTAGGATGTLSADSHALLDRFYTFAIDMPTGPNGEDRPEDIYNRLYGLQWDLSGIGPLASCSIEFSGVEHSQLYQLRLDQSSHSYGATSVFPKDAIWNAGAADDGWSSPGNWQENLPPAAGRNIRFDAGNSTTLSSPLSAKSLTFATPDSFSIGGGAAIVSLTSGINATSSSISSHQISLPLVFENYNLIDLAEGNTLTLSGPVSGAGFYKQGAGNFILSGDNTYDSANASFQTNGLIIRGGQNTITGSNTLIGNAPATFNIRPDTSVVLTDGDQRLDPKFTANLLGATSRLVLGSAAGKSDQTFAGLTGSVSNVPVTGSRISGGSAHYSTLTIQSTGATIFAGDIGGPGEFDNHLHLIKSGSGLQFLTGSNSFTGFTKILGGALVLDPGGHTIELSGGILALNDVDYEATLGTAAGNLRFTGNGGFAANGDAPHQVTLNGGAALAWDQLGFLTADQKLLLSAAGTNQTIELTNPLDLGSNARVIQVEDSLHNTDARLSGSISGSGGFAKTGSGILEISAANSSTGVARVLGGTLTIAGENGSFAGPLTAEPGSFIRVINLAGADHDNRLSPISPTTLRGAFFTFNSAPDGTLESTGPLVIANGANTVSTSRADAGAAGILTFSQLDRSIGTTVNFSGTGIGLADARNQVRFTNAPVPGNGLIGGWAVAGNEFATVGPLGITAVTSYNSNAESTWTEADNVKLSAADPASPTTTLSASKVINSLRIVGATGGNFGNVLDLGGNTLRIQSGGILTNSGADTRTSKINHGILTANSELIVFSNGPTDIAATIADPSAGSPLALVKSGSQVLNLRSSIASTGPVIINQGVLKLSANASLNSSPLIRVNAGGTLNVGDFSGGYVIPPQQTLSGNGTVNGTLSVSGTLAPGASAQTPLTISGSLIFNTGSTLSIPIEASASLPLYGALNITGSVNISSGTRLAITTDAASPFWAKPRSFTILNAVSLNDEPQLNIESDLINGTWSVSHSTTSITLDWSPLTPVQTWRKSYFGTIENIGDASDFADPDFDELSNLLEYALGTDPKSASNGPALTADREFAFDITGSPALDVTYEVQASSDLSSWKTVASLAPASGWTWAGAGASRIEVTSSSTNSRIVIGDEALSPAADRRFLRLKVSHP